VITFFSHFHAFTPLRLPSNRLSSILCKLSRKLLLRLLLGCNFLDCVTRSGPRSRPPSDAAEVHYTKAFGLACVFCMFFLRPRPRQFVLELDFCVCGIAMCIFLLGSCEFGYRKTGLRNITCRSRV